MPSLRRAAFARDIGRLGVSGRFGLPRGLSGHAISTADRILAAADSYHALTEARPHRLPRSGADAAELRAGSAPGG